MYMYVRRQERKCEHAQYVEVGKGSRVPKANIVPVHTIYMETPTVSLAWQALASPYIYLPSYEGNTQCY